MLVSHNGTYIIRNINYNINPLIDVAYLTWHLKELQPAVDKQLVEIRRIWLDRL